jgi:hypothetical protein
MRIQMIFWFVTMCIVISGYQHLRGTVPFSPYSAQKMQAVDSYEMLVSGYQTVWHHSAKDTNPNSNSSLYY